MSASPFLLVNTSQNVCLPQIFHGQRLMPCSTKEVSQRGKHVKARPLLARRSSGSYRVKLTRRQHLGVADLEGSGMS